MAFGGEDRNIYKPLENILNNINKKFIQVSDEEEKRNKVILRELLDLLISKMKQVDNLFAPMFSEVFYGGSYYDGMHVGTPDKFDLNLLLTLPKLVEPKLVPCNLKGSLQLKLNYPALKKLKYMETRYKKLRNLLEDGKDNFLDNEKVREWMESVVARALNQFDQCDGQSILATSMGTFFVKAHKRGEALNIKLQVTHHYSWKSLNIDIYLVPCFVFGEEKWPQPPFRAKPMASKENFFIIPKPIKNASDHNNRYWSLSFQKQEREIINNKYFLKPAVKLLKKIKDKYKHNSITSYDIKTIVLWEIDNRTDEFWRRSLSEVFMMILKKYCECLSDKKIPYYWYNRKNLIEDVKDSTRQMMQNTYQSIIDNIESSLPYNPNIVNRYLLTKDEYHQNEPSSSSLGVATIKKDKREPKYIEFVGQSVVGTKYEYHQNKPSSPSLDEKDKRGLSNEKSVGISAVEIGALAIGALAIGALSLWKVFSNTNNKRK